MNNATYIRNAANIHSAEWLAEQERKSAERRAALEARQAEFRAKHPDIAAAMER
jgi:hypothetical protein